MWKLLPWSGRQPSGYPQRQCFFCCTTSIILPPYGPDNKAHGSSNVHTPHPSTVATSCTTIISTGTPINWFCSHCHCQNVTLEDGTLVEQYTRPMWDEEWNRNRSHLLQHTRPSKSGKPAKTSSPTQPRTLPGKDGFTFCHTCRTNQVLRLNMLADYLPSEDDAEYREKLEELPAYEASIAARYPAVCADCAPKVQERISERDQFARSWSLGKWLELKKKASLADLADGQGARGAKASVSSSDPIPSNTKGGLRSATTVRLGIASRISGIVDSEHGSRLAMAVFVLVNASIWAGYLAVCLNPVAAASSVQLFRDRIQSQPFSTYTASAALLALLATPKLLQKCSRFDPLKRSSDKARARQMRVEATGLQLWRLSQQIILSVRITILVLTAIASLRADMLDSAICWLQRDPTQLLWLSALTMLTSETSITLLAASQLRLDSPTPLQLVSKPIVPNGAPSRIDFANDPLLTSLSLCAAAPQSSQSNGFGMATAGSQEDNETFLPQPQRDADGDAVMQDAATYTARRASISSEQEWEQCSSQIAPAPARPSVSTWSSNSFAPASAATSTSINRSNTRCPPKKYNNFQLGPQRFWEPQNPTGLEDVFGRAVSLDDGPPQHAQQRDDAESGGGSWSKWFGSS
ncbi:uncharacterized protein UHO2_00709 [Ustilago hordei]|uniref:Ima1 N-terminal domain-containing protein n=1 Tax=Ustilago hordei TaxID=120017 RepID=I2FWJ0_USTHO|nr:uncharacterized protein UHO2_00709 [Ustilago hordei]KAJ1587032.1 hypothetical protein NDA15_001294 [Ustilago hordei]KAJ1589992.1 hypothetical protein NDA12_002831 [Ustilago hordei]UTT96282.1 hypothetical protein NDA17_004565 [Ustilago hordei]CCF51283.1 uncharacterized protein UHOR_01198 [Ustilago hordei]SYW82224.1 uncharacterized protein UHO2_00709 [Ustilago hordei]